MSLPSKQHASTTTASKTLGCIKIPMRHWILILSGVGLMISYAGAEFGYNKSQQGVILASFFFGYIITPILGGTLSDRYGGKTVLATGALVWTVFTLCTPLAAAMGLTWAVIARIGLGLGEGTWIPPCERSKAVASVTACAYLGSVIALPTSSALVVSSWGWRSIFWLFGTLGLLWSIAWQIFGASDPLSSTLISENEVRWILQQKRLDHIQGQDQEALNRPTDITEPTDRDSGEQLEDENEHIRTVSSSGEPILYMPLSSIPLEQNTSRHSEGSDGPVLRTRLESSLEERVEQSMDTTTRNLSERSSSESANESSKTMSRWLTFRNRKRADGVVQTGSPKTPVPWKQLLTRREIWAIIISQFCNSLGFFVMQSWVPTFYLDFYGVDVGKIGYFTVLPSAIQGAMGLLAGYLGDKAIQDWNWSPLMVRRAGQSVGSFGLGVFLLLAVKLAHTATMAMILITIGMALNGFTMVGASVYQMYGFTNESAAFLMAAVYGVLLFVVKIAFWLHERSQRRDGKVDWEDEVVLITGGASGIGYLLAEMLAIRHITVVVLDVHPVKTALDIESYICDVSDPEDIARAAKEIREDVGEPTILVNNAGIINGRSILDLSTEDIKHTININYLGQAFTIKEFLPDMIKNNHGHIITVSSAMGILAAPQIADYAASKAAVKAFHETLESEIKYVYKTPGVRTTLVCCGKIETGMFQGVKERMPFFTPTLEPLEVVKEIMESMEKRRTHNQIMMPFYVNFVPLVSILPGWFQDLARTVSGADKAMDTFVGKKGAQPRSTLQVVDAFPIGGESSEDKKKDL
ncbi:hypothetical protein BGZ96_011427 [Linnemannia gamsii]|uniref:Ketoreductase domain-containing protein n=1 Tax=Linnemannia gamsii TaxID=64522 RepID=A0ABQ7KCK6_9FUNG|nr:hypothetical protein BGZ96_011427 [Linnemannia gamsii]